MKKEIQINVVKELSDNERARLAAHLAFVLLVRTTSQTVTRDEQDAADILLSHNIPFPRLH